MKARAILLGILALALASGACKKKEASLSLLVWEGYADPATVHAFEESRHCKVMATYMGTSDELVAKLRGGSASNYDVISPSSDVATSIVRAGLVAPLDLSKLPTYSQLSAKLRDENGAAIFSLRPEAIRPASADATPHGSVRFRATLQQQFYGGASELLEVNCGSGQLLRIRIPARGPLFGEHEFVFSPADAIRVQE